ncbi:uncharacterized protein LOC132192829 isoform X2 [Neocloeon triangulifer]|uniref:uncharacterized protein LOC132192829 isoform X2 n=1 Tax=Neocloeon triangulifer TaxID=2078957 RepID=UPI00286F51A7|nr:uncharacterized protein LOC132192829 isoform X2 [Neocloeon triangulifer]
MELHRKSILVFIFCLLQKSSLQAGFEEVELEIPSIFQICKKQQEQLVATIEILTKEIKAGGKKVDELLEKMDRYEQRLQKIEGQISSSISKSVDSLKKYQNSSATEISKRISELNVYVPAVIKEQFSNLFNEVGMCDKEQTMQEKMESQRNKTFLQRGISGTIFTSEEKTYFFSYSPVFKDKNLKWCQSHNMKLALFETARENLQVSLQLNQLISENLVYWIQGNKQDMPHAKPTNLKFAVHDFFLKLSSKSGKKGKAVALPGNGKCTNLTQSVDEHFAHACNISMHFLCQL